ncbi:MAG: glycosyltransferase family 39 protein [Chloroflexi bacterium]|nr:glycosyltransferase family 39 protein [Chloroflexota bacterium]
MPVKKRNIIVILSLVLLSALAVQPLFAGLPRGHDTLLHFYRIPQLNSLLAQGILFSRWAPDLMFGYGYPLFNFYPPLSPYVITCLYWLVGQNAVLATTIGFGLVLIVGLIGMYLAGKIFYKTWGGLVAAVAYTLAPHLLYQTYERGSISTAMAMSAFPWVIWTLYKAARSGSFRWLVGAAATVMVMLASHTSASLLFLPAAVVLGIMAACASETPKERLSSISRIAVAVLAGLGLAAFIWVPALTEYPLTQYQTAVSPSNIHYYDYFADVWKWPGKVLDGAINAPLAQSPGLAQMVLAALALVIGCIRLLTGKTQYRNTQWIIVVCGVLGFGYTFMATRFSGFLWERLPLLLNLQFPWRFLDAGTIFISLACAGLLADALCKKRYLFPVLAVLAMCANALPYLYPPRWHSLPSQPSLVDATRVQSQYGMLGLTSWGEYLPLTATWRADAPAYAGSDQGIPLAAKLQAASLVNGEVKESGGNSLNARLRLVLDEPADLVFDTYYYPGWRAIVDGRRIPVSANQLGLVTFTVPDGDHVVELYFGETWQRLLADGASILTLILLVIGLLVNRGKHKAQVPATDGSDYTSPWAAWLFPGLLALIFVTKITYFDHYNTPAVVHYSGGELPGMRLGEAGTSDAIRVLAFSYDEPELTLYWQAVEKPSTNYSVRLAFEDEAGNVFSSQTRDHPGFSATDTWESGQLVQDSYKVALDNPPHSGKYRLYVSLYQGQVSADKQPIMKTEVGSLNIPGKVPSKSLDLSFAGKFILDSFELPETIRGGSVEELVLNWRCLEEQNTDYTVFIHFLNADGTLALIADAQPLSGTYPTSYWNAGDTVADVHAFTAALAPGEYQVEIGWYLAATGERLQPQGPGSTASASAVIGTITVEGE